MSVIHFLKIIKLQVYVISTKRVNDGLCLVRKRVSGVQYFLEHHYGFFYILTNAPLEGSNSTVDGYYLARCIAEKSSIAEWQVFLMIMMDVLKTHLYNFSSFGLCIFL